MGDNNNNNINNIYGDPAAGPKVQLGVCSVYEMGHVRLIWWRPVEHVEASNMLKEIQSSNL